MGRGGWGISMVFQTCTQRDGLKEAEIYSCFFFGSEKQIGVQMQDEIAERCFFSLSLAPVPVCKYESFFARTFGPFGRKWAKGSRFREP